MVFLAEILTNDARLEFVQRSIGFDHRWVVPRVGRGCGLVLYWKASIKVRMNLQVSPLHQVANQVRAMLAQYQANTQIAEMHVVSSGIGGTRWRPPQSSFVKVHFDGPVFGNSNMSGIEAIIRNHNGAAMAFCAKKFDQAYKAKEIEALAALKFAYELGFQNAILKGVSLGLIEALKAKDHKLSPLGLLVEDVKLFANNFVRLSYSHIKRSGNSVAHNLAKHAICIPDFQVWMKNVPSHVVSFLQSDVVGLS